MDKKYKIMNAVCVLVLLFFLNSNLNAQALLKPSSLSEVHAEIFQCFKKDSLQIKMEDISELCAKIKVAHFIKNESLEKNKLMKYECLILLLAIISKEIDPKFDFTKLPSISVSPPPETGLPSGVDPSCIKDRSLREKYESDIKQNQKLLVSIRQQRKLLNLQQVMVEYTSSFVGGDFDKNDIEKLRFVWNSFFKEESSMGNFIKTISEIK